MASPHSTNLPTETGTEDPLDLETLDSDSLFKALTNVEKAIPDLLSSVKPILAHLVSTPEDEEEKGLEARVNVEKYMTTLDKIQFILRQTVYYLHETRSSPNLLNPRQPQDLPTTFASTLPIPSSSLASSSSPHAPLPDNRAETGKWSNGDKKGKTGDYIENGSSGGRGLQGATMSGSNLIPPVELGLYASRLEAKFLKEMRDSLDSLRALQDREAGDMRGRTDGGIGQDSVAAERSQEMIVDTPNT